jgi:hypothetical protein
MYRGWYVIILSYRKCCCGEQALLLVNKIDFAVLCTEKHGIYMYCEQMHYISEHCAYSAWQCICKFMFSWCMIMFRKQERGCFQNVCCKCIHHLQCTSPPPLFYSQTTAEAVDFWLPAKIDHWAEQFMVKVLFYFCMFLSSHSLGNAKVTQFILLSRYINP